MKKAFLLLLAVGMMTACGEKKRDIPELDPAFINYVSAFTSGVVSATSNVALSLVSDLPESIREEALDEGLLEIEH